MPKSNSYVCVDLPKWAKTALCDVAAALQREPAKHLGVEGTSFRPHTLESIHMTCLFCGKSLCELSSGDLSRFHGALTQLAGLQAEDARLEFLRYELFPPDKQNEVVALFRASPKLRALQAGTVTAAGAHGLQCLKDVVEHSEESWCAHVTLGKIGAKSDSVGSLRLQHLPFPFSAALSESGSIHAKGLILVGDQPSRLHLDWHLPFLLGPGDHARRALEELAAQEPSLALDHAMEALAAGNPSGLALAGVAEAQLGQSDHAVTHLREALAAEFPKHLQTFRGKCVSMLQRLEQKTRAAAD